MKFVYTDLHIHTSDNPNNLNQNYDVQLLAKKVKEMASNCRAMISLTDHNTINKKAYLELVSIDEVTIILGVELHIRKFENVEPYHCHIYINTPITADNIDSVNKILDELFPDKQVTDEMEKIPSIEDISNSFDSYDYLMLPHGGQSHRTFDKALQKGKDFDTTLERSLYFNQFDGFTSRSSKGVGKTSKYFERLGIKEFTNLITCSDNYNPELYPDTKASCSEEFVPTWICASPSFEGLRISLSESSRLHYGTKPPDFYSMGIGLVKLENDKADIDVTLCPGLNVVIGGSSSGKTLFVDSIYRKINKDYNECNYTDYSVKDLYVENPSGCTPHYINQNFIVSILQSKDKGINDIELISKVFPEDDETTTYIQKTLSEFKKLLDRLMTCVKKIESYQHELRSISTLNELIIAEPAPKNVIECLCPSDREFNLLQLSEVDHMTYRETLKEIAECVKANPLGNNIDESIRIVIKEMDRLLFISKINIRISETLLSNKEKAEEELESETEANKQKSRMRARLLSTVLKYFSELRTYQDTLNKLMAINAKYKTKKVKVLDHMLQIENSFELKEDMFRNAINDLLKRDNRVDALSNMQPEDIFECNYSERPKVKGYEDFSSKIFAKVNGSNKKKYVITTKDGHDFDSLSPGWKSAIILDLILGYDKDIAPIIIDQPEDNLATAYMNHDLITRIKGAKVKKQVILVSHNATIPILGDAQNVIVCENRSEKIFIRSAPLEGKIDGELILDKVAEMTDGGKPSIKKRIKKYNLKSYRGS